MKRIITAFAATLLFASLFASCSWFNRKSDPHSDIAGTWRFDSVVKKNDSTADAMPALLMALAAGDTTPVTYTFTADSLQAAGGNGVFESVAYRYEQPTVSLLDSSGEKFEVIRPADSALILRTNDSARMYFTRQ